MQNILNKLIHVNRQIFDSQILTYKVFFIGLTVTAVGLISIFWFHTQQEETTLWIEILTLFGLISIGIGVTLTLYAYLILLIQRLKK